MLMVCSTIDDVKHCLLGSASALSADGNGNSSAIKCAVDGIKDPGVKCALMLLRPTTDTSDGGDEEQRALDVAKVSTDGSTQCDGICLSAIDLIWD